MTLTATYAGDLSRVRLAFTGAPADADYAWFERSTDGITWTTVRGGLTVAITAGAGKLDDYEFTAGVLNTYRVSYVDSAAMSWIGSSGPFTGNNASLAVAYNGSTAVGDLILCLATIRNSGAGVPNQPSGWTTLVDMGNVRLFGKIHDGTAAPTITFTGGVANADTTAQTTTFRNAALTPVGGPAIQTNASAQNIAYPAVTPGSAPSMVVVLGWKQDDWTGSPTIPGFDAELGNISTTTGDDAAAVWWYRAKFTTAQQPAGSFTVTGGGSAISKAATVMFGKRPYSARDTQTITPVLTGVWIKNPSRPSLNIQVDVNDVSAITRSARTEVFDIIGRTNPVVVSDVQSSRSLTLVFTTKTLAEYRDMDARLATGQPIFVQAPGLDEQVPTMYAVIRDITVSKNSMFTEWRQFTLPLVEVAAPGVTIAGDTILWLDVVATYATWADVVTAKSSWSNLQDSIADSGEVIVP